jgi:hypothetical protein
MIPKTRMVVVQRRARTARPGAAADKRSRVDATSYVKPRGAPVSPESSVGIPSTSKQAATSAVIALIRFNRVS